MTRLHCVTASDVPHCVGTFGHVVVLTGQNVCVAVPSRQMVGSVPIAQRVVTAGQLVMTTGHLVSPTGQTVGVLVPSGQIVWSPG